MDKVERLIAIIMILLKKEVVSAREFSRLFNVSKRTIVRDMETLSLSNIPVYACNGVNGGYGIMAEYKVDKRLLSSSDLENILTALNGLEQIFVSHEVERTIRKIEAMVSPLPLRRSIQLSFYDWQGRTELLQTLKLCQQSILERRLISFDYVDKHGARTNRIVEPYQLHFSETSWYLKAFCLQRLEYRTFKLSRIDRLRMDEAIFSPRDYQLEQKYEASYQPQLVTIKALISPGIKDRLIERYGRSSIEDYSSELHLATIHIPQNNDGFQFLAGFGTNLVIVEPKTYVDEYRSFLSIMLAKLSRGDTMMTSSKKTLGTRDQEMDPNTGFLSLLSNPARRALEHRGIATLQELSAFTEREILQLHGIGPRSMPTLRDALHAQDLTFKHENKKSD